jgi:hypothetical protein
MQRVPPPLSAVCSVLALLGAGCATPSAIPPGTACQITSSRAPFYKYGPAQTFGPDEILGRGTRVTLMSRDMGFSRVMLENGVTGYVANEDVDVLPPEPVPTAQPAVVTQRAERLFRGSPRRSNVQPTPGDPLFDMSDMPLPIKEEPTPQPEAETNPESQPP